MLAGPQGARPCSQSPLPVSSPASAQIPVGSLLTPGFAMQAEQGQSHRQQAERQQALCIQLQASLAEAQAGRHTAEHQLQQYQLSMGSEQSTAQLRAMIASLQQEVQPVPALASL